MSTAMVLLAAGSGRRMGAEGNKILLSLHGKTLLEHCLSAVEESGVVDEVVVVIRECDEEAIRE